MQDVSLSYTFLCIRTLYYGEVIADYITIGENSFLLAGKNLEWFAISKDIHTKIFYIITKNVPLIIFYMHLRIIHEKCKGTNSLMKGVYVMMFCSLWC